MTTETEVFSPTQSKDEWQKTSLRSYTPVGKKISLNFENSPWRSTRSSLYISHSSFLSCSLFSSKSLRILLTTLYQHRTYPLPISCQFLVVVTSHQPPSSSSTFSSSPSSSSTSSAQKAKPITQFHHDKAHYSHTRIYFLKIFATTDNREKRKNQKLIMLFGRSLSLVLVKNIFTLFVSPPFL